jgi:UDP-N-acetylglucosamine acyltransferase
MVNNEYPGNTIHPAAIIHPSVKMGKGNYIGAFTIIDENVEIGNNNHFGSHCIIGDLGESINFFDQERKGVVIGDENRFTKQVTIDSGTLEPTIVKNNTLWLKNAHAGHDCVIGNRSQLRCNAIIGGHVIVDEDVRINLGVIIHPRVEILKACIFGMGAIVTKKITLVEKGIYVGNPAKLLRVQD